MKDNPNRRDKALFAVAIASGKSAVAAGRIAGASRATAYRWAKQPALRKRVEELRRDMLAEASGKLSASATAASEALHRLLRSSNESIVLGAARTILQASLRVREAVELEDRLALIEEKLAFEHAKLRLREAYLEIEGESEERGDGIA